VCSNLCIAADGAVVSIKADDTERIKEKSYATLSGFNFHRFAEQLEQMTDRYLSVEEFATFVGRVRMGHYNKGLDTKQWLGDQQMARVVRGYYEDPDFRASDDGTISVWNLYNLMTRANRNSYIDTVLDRSISAIEMLSI